MNCSKCGSPLGLRPFSDRTKCVYCGSVERHADRESGLDRIVWSDEPIGNDCPRCHHSLVRVSIDAHTAAACSECHGVLFSNHVFGSIVQQRRSGFRGAERSPQPVDREQLHQSASCPGCSARMETHIYAGPGCQVIDSCASCHLVWIDSGELAAIERAPGRR